MYGYDSNEKCTPLGTVMVMALVLVTVERAAAGASRLAAVNPISWGSVIDGGINSVEAYAETNVTAVTVAYNISVSGNATANGLGGNASCALPLSSKFVPIGTSNGVNTYCKMSLAWPGHGTVNATHKWNAVTINSSDSF